MIAPAAPRGVAMTRSSEGDTARRLQTPVPAVAVRALTREFGRVPALRDTNLDVPAGALAVLTGPAAAGKTTLLCILAGLLPPTRGTARICGFDTVREQARAGRHVGFLPQSPYFHGWMTGRETLQFAGRGLSRIVPCTGRHAAGLLALAGLADAADRSVDGYTEGMRRRLGIARALIGWPSVLLLDEPAGSLDPADRRDVLDLVERLRPGRTVLIATRGPSAGDLHASQRLVLSAGHAARECSHV